MPCSTQYEYFHIVLLYSVVLYSDENIFLNYHCRDFFPYNSLMCVYNIKSQCIEYNSILNIGYNIEFIYLFLPNILLFLIKII